MMEPMQTRTIMAAAFLLANAASAQETTLTIAPSQPAPGAIVQLTLRPASTGDTIVEITGRMSGESLHFQRTAGGAWRALGPVSVDATGSVSADVIMTRASGASDTVTAAVDLPKPKPRKPGASRPRALAVSPRFTNPLDAETEARIARENAQAREIGRSSHSTPQMWTAPFLRPRAAVVTSRFGSGRMFNGTLTSRHLGVDFRGATGEPVRAANRGVVALVGDFFLAGNVVYVDHGAGVVTAYFHLSKTLVAAGDTVERGQEIGLVGATGRVTGPHLHWSARYGAVTVNPLDLVAITAP
jgi:murein DD-endopeptidase MepM/ murein hydrolase activator NlpD